MKEVEETTGVVIEGPRTMQKGQLHSMMRRYIMKHRTEAEGTEEEEDIIMLDLSSVSQITS